MDAPFIVSFAILSCTLSANNHNPSMPNRPPRKRTQDAQARGKQALRKKHKQERSVPVAGLTYMTTRDGVSSSIKHADGKTGRLSCTSTSMCRSTGTVRYAMAWRST